LSHRHHHFLNKQAMATTDDRSIRQPTTQLEAKGVHLKHFEKVLVKLLPHIEPKYTLLPQPPPTTATTGEEKWLNWDDLPPAARVYGTLPGQLLNLQRATRKEQQIESLLRCIFLLLDDKPAIATHSTTTDDIDEHSRTIVDFGGGSGHLAIPLALMLPQYKIVVVDLKSKSLEFLRVKANQSYHQPKEHDKLERPASLPGLHVTAVPNLYTHLGDIESYVHPFHLGVALHVCGEATDVVLRKCARNQAHLVVAPCCVGKLNRQKLDPYVFRAKNQRCNDIRPGQNKQERLDPTAQQNSATISYPQSEIFKQCLQCSPDEGSNKSNTINDDWDALSKAADYSHELDMNNRRNAARRAAKGILEMDRKLFLEHTYPYKAALTRMEPLTCTPKHDVLVAYYACKGTKMPAGIRSMMVAEKQHVDQVFKWTKDHLLSGNVGDRQQETKDNNNQQPTEVHSRKRNRVKASISKADRVDWSWEEEETVRKELLVRFPPECDQPQKSVQESDYIFPAGMGGRKRKLVHFVAEQLALAHWSVGKKHAEKTVGVRRRHTASKSL